MVYGLVYHELLVPKPLSQLLALDEMPPLYSAPLDGALPCNLREDVPHTNFLLSIMVAGPNHCGCSNLP